MYKIDLKDWLHELDSIIMKLLKLRKKKWKPALNERKVGLLCLVVEGLLLRKYGSSLKMFWQLIQPRITRKHSQA